MATVTNRLGCLSVLVFLLTSSTLVTSRDLRMKREISHDTTSSNTSDIDSTTSVTEAQDIKHTTVAPLVSNATHAIEMNTGNNSVTTVDHQHASDSNHTQENEASKTSENGNHTAGTETVTAHSPTGNERTLYTQPRIRNSTGHVSQTGSSAPTFPAKVTEMHTTASPTKRGPQNTTVLSSTTQSTTTKQTSTTGKTNACSTASSSRHGLVSRCLIAIASMAALTTIFVISTICLATKLSGYRYRHKARLLQETEMVCISALMNDTDHPVPKPRHPKSNGALIPSTEDGDPDEDNLTLNSFLPDSEGLL